MTTILSAQAAEARAKGEDLIRTADKLLCESRPLACFAGIWTSWTSVRKVKEGEINIDVFGFLSCESNVEVKRMHPKAMPVSLTTNEEYDV